MEHPSRLLTKFSQKLFPNTSERQSFINALIHPQPFHPCILWTKPKPVDHPFSIEPPLPWQPNFIDRLAIGERPGKHPLHDQGYFYCLDFSSIFAASVLLSIPPPVQTIVDVCAAPGGKSLFAWVALQPETLICNEVIGKRIGALKSNLKRCDVTATLLNQDSSVLPQALESAAQVVLVDAPCTGQSLLAKGEPAPGCFHPVSINKNANRQKRILANSAQLVAPNGYLVYMTCAYSIEENEQVVDWFLERFPQFKPIVVPHLSIDQSHLTSRPCYRIWPQSKLGAGAFVSILTQY